MGISGRRKIRNVYDLTGCVYIATIDYTVCYYCAHYCLARVICYQTNLWSLDATDNSRCQIAKIQTLAQWLLA